MMDNNPTRVEGEGPTDQGMEAVCTATKMVKFTFTWI